MQTQALNDSMNLAAIRVERLEHITQAQYIALYNKVVPRLPAHIAEDAFCHAMEVATLKYDGRAKLENFVTRVARNYAIDHHRKHRKAVQFTDLHRADDHDDDNADNPIEALGAKEDRIEDPYKLIFATHVANMLRGEMMECQSKGERLNLERAAMAFETLVASAADDYGVGVDEYEEPQRDQAHSVQAAPRSQIEDRLAALLSAKACKPIGKKTVESVSRRLRQSVKYYLDTLSPHVSLHVRM